MSERMIDMYDVLIADFRETNNYSTWNDFYTGKAKSKDSDAWRQSHGAKAAWRERTVRVAYFRALAGAITAEDKAYHEMLACSEE